MLARMVGIASRRALARALDPATNRPRVSAVSEVDNPSLRHHDHPKRRDSGAVHADREEVVRRLERRVSLGARIVTLPQ